MTREEVDQIRAEFADQERRPTPCHYRPRVVEAMFIDYMNTTEDCASRWGLTVRQLERVFVRWYLIDRSTTKPGGNRPPPLTTRRTRRVFQLLAAGGALAKRQ